MPDTNKSFEPHELEDWSLKIIDLLRNDANNKMTYEKVMAILNHTSEVITKRVPLWYKEN